MTAGAHGLINTSIILMILELDLLRGWCDLSVFMDLLLHLRRLTQVTLEGLRFNLFLSLNTVIVTFILGASLGWIRLEVLLCLL